MALRDILYTQIGSINDIDVCTLYLVLPEYISEV